MAESEERDEDDRTEAEQAFELLMSQGKFNEACDPAKRAAEEEFSGSSEEKQKWIETLNRANILCVSVDADSPDHLVVIENLPGLRNQLQDDRSDILVVATGNDKEAPQWASRYEYRDSDKEYSCAIMYYNKPVYRVYKQGEDTCYDRYPRLLCFLNAGTVDTDIGHLPLHPEVSVTFVPENLQVHYKRHKFKGSICSVVPRKRPYYIVGNPRKVMKYLIRLPFSQDTRVLTMLAMTYPNMSDRFITFATEVDCEEARKRLKVDEPEEHLVSNDFGKTVAVAQVTWLLGMAYTREDNRFDQLYRRGSALASSAGTEWDQSFDIKKFHNMVINASYESNGVIDQAIGNIIAIDQNGNYKPDVTKDEIADLTYYSNQGGSNAWGRSLAEQMRLVYHEFRLKSVGFAGLAIDLMGEAMIRLGEPWVTEVALAKSALDRKSNRPYLGLVEKLDTVFYVANFPRCVLGGTMLHRVGLETDQERKDFESLVVAGIIAKIGDNTDMFILRVLVEQCAPRKIAILAKIVNSLSLMKAKEIVNTLTPEDQSALLYRIHQEETKGEWFTWKANELHKAEIARIQETAGSMIKAEIAARTQQFIMMVNHLPKEEQMDAYRVVTTYMQKLSANMMGKATLKETITRPILDFSPKLFDEEVDRMDGIFKTILNLKFKDVYKSPSSGPTEENNENPDDEFNDDAA